MKHLKVLVALIALTLTITACTVPVAVVQPDGSTNTVQVVDPKLEQSLTAAQLVNAASAPFNPYSAVIAWGLGVIAAAAAWIAKIKNDRAAKADLILKTVVQGVENSGSAEAKTAIQKQATAIGVEGDLGTIVQAVNSGLK